MCLEFLRIIITVITEAIAILSQNILPFRFCTSAQLTGREIFGLSLGLDVVNYGTEEEDEGILIASSRIVTVI